MNQCLLLPTTILLDDKKNEILYTNLKMYKMTDSMDVDNMPELEGSEVIGVNAIEDLPIPSLLQQTIWYHRIIEFVHASQPNDNPFR